MSIEIKISKKPVDYLKALNLLEKRHKNVINDKMPELIWVLNHPSVFTAGVSYEEKHLLDKKQKVIRTNRGGKITYHGPGQIIFYFVINLNKRKKDVRKFIKVIEKTIVETLSYFKIKSYPNRKNVGIWVKHKKKNKKIAAIGIRIKKWIAYHGFSLNVNVDLKMYNKIIPCGLKNRNVININSLINIKGKNIKKKLVMNFLKNLNN